MTGTEGIGGIVLRLSPRVPGEASAARRVRVLYGPGTAFAADGAAADQVRERRFRSSMAGTGVQSFVHVDDAAAETVVALARGRTGIYNIVDDEPAPIRDWLPAYAAALGAKRPLRVPSILARPVGGRYVPLLRARGPRGLERQGELGREPRRRTWRDGFPESLAARSSKVLAQWPHP